MIEIKFIGRGGQGVKTASYIVAFTAFKDSYDVQAFPEFGPEREGAPVFAFTRIDKDPIKVHFGIKTPNIVVVIDPTLISEIDCFSGIKDGGSILINTSEDLSKFKKLLPKKGKLFTVDASDIAIKNFGKNIPNTPMLGALCKVYPELNLKSLQNEIKAKFEKKLSKELVLKNLKAIELAYKEVKVL
jgi:pyruvate ferredoxin oxidoreductase gamma subunit